MNNVKVIAILLIVGFAWLQYNLGFYAALSALILLAVVIVFSLAINHQKAVSESLLQHKQADLRIQLEQMRIVRQSMISDVKLENRAAQMAMPLVRHSVGAIKAQLEAKYAAKYNRFRLTQDLPDESDLPEEEEAVFDPYSVVDAEYENLGETVDATAW